jgi:hypothetical protein
VTETSGQSPSGRGRPSQSAASSILQDLAARREFGVRSDALDDYVFCVARKGFEISRIRGEDSSTRLGERHNERVDSRATTSEPSEQSRPAGHRFWDCLGDVAGLEKPILVGVTTRVPLKAFDQDNAGNPRRPKALLTKREYQRERFPRTLRQAGDPTRIENEHER